MFNFTFLTTDWPDLFATARRMTRGLAPKLSRLPIPDKAMPAT